MFVDRETTGREPEAQFARDPVQQAARILGHVVQCDGSHATIVTTAAGGASHEGGHWSVGRFISISLASGRTVGLVHDVKVEDGWQEDRDNRILVSVELIGEVRDREGKSPIFDRGITEYPHIGAIAHRIRQRDLAAVYQLGGQDTVAIGTLSQDAGLIAHIAMNRTLDRHFAVVGSTGVGKSTAVSLLLHKAVQSRPNLRVMILDPHNEFARAFGSSAQAIDIDTLDIPFWMFRLEELVEVIYRGREWVAEEVDVLRDIIPLAKRHYSGGGVATLRMGDQSSFTADTPVPYRMADVLAIIDEKMGLLESRDLRPVYKTLRQRLDAAMRDPRFRFMFGARMVEDNITSAIGRIFRVPMNGKPVACLQLAGAPPEVVNSVCSVIARLAFDLCQYSKGDFEFLMLCEEAHRYMPSDPRLGFAPTRHALARIAKEGRKYNCYLGVVTQRPGELDPTILSQCSTVFAMRLANEQDQAIIRSAISDSSASAMSFLSSMGQREAIAFGDGVAMTMRMKFETLDPSLIPGTGEGDPDQRLTQTRDIDLASIVDKLRHGLREMAEEERLMGGMMNGSVAPAASSHNLGEQRPTLSRLVPDHSEPLPPRRSGQRLFGPDDLK
ncbi:MAG: ATP-binding protein [Mesorhizobium sp.]